MKDNVLHVENVTMQFGGVVAVNNLSLDINKDEIVALIGPNGVQLYNRRLRTYKRTCGFQRKNNYRKSSPGKDENGIQRRK